MTDYNYNNSSAVPNLVSVTSGVPGVSTVVSVPESESFGNSARATVNEAFRAPSPLEFSVTSELRGVANKIGTVLNLNDPTTVDIITRDNTVAAVSERGARNVVVSVFSTAPNAA